MLRKNMEKYEKMLLNVDKIVLLNVEKIILLNVEKKYGIIF